MNEIIIDGVIGRGDGEYSSTMFKASLALCEQGQPLRIRIHSEGGSVFEGFAIYDELEKWAGHKVASIESSAFSIASFIPMACDEIEISPNGYLMLHAPYTLTEGDDTKLMQDAALLKSLREKMVAAYSARMNIEPEEVQQILSRDSYYDANEAQRVGLVDRVVGKPKACRKFENTKNMPHGVVAALFGVGSSGDDVTPQQETEMSETKVKVAATVREIKAAFPKAKNEFIVRCMEKEMAMEDVAAEMTEELTEENETLLARVSAMEEEISALKAKAMEETTGAEAVPSVPEETNTMTAKAQWDDAIDGYVKRGMTKQKAVLAANRNNPGLRERMLAEVR